MPVLTRSQKRQQNMDIDSKQSEQRLSYLTRPKRKRAISSETSSNPSKRARLSQTSKSQKQKQKNLSVPISDFKNYFTVASNDNLLKYDLSIYIDKSLSKTVQCPICLSICKDAMYVGCKERHKICKTCLNDIYDHANNNDTDPMCPQCRQEIMEYEESDRKPFRVINEIVSNLMIKCPNKIINNKNTFVCDWIGKNKEFEKHLTFCEYRLGKCNNCEKEIYSKNISKHINKCFKKCNLCSKIISNKLYKIHITLKCLELLEKCDKCQLNIKKKNILNHKLNICKMRKYYCHICQINVFARNKNIHDKKNEIKHIKYKMSQLTTKNNKLLNENKILKERFNLIDVNLNESEIDNLQTNNKIDVRQPDGKWMEVYIKRYDNESDFIYYSINKEYLHSFDLINKKIYLTDSYKLARPGIISKRQILTEAFKNIKINDMILVNCDNIGICDNNHCGWRQAMVTEIDNNQIKCQFYCDSCGEYINCGWMHPDCIDEVKPLL